MPRLLEVLDISIHVPREGDDAQDGAQRVPVVVISIHVPREGDDDGIRCAAGADGDDFNPRPP